MIICKIDCREHELIRICKFLIESNSPFKEITFSVESLPIGDVVFVDDQTGEEKILIERKTIQDLNSSIKDGRYEEQSFRLNGSNVHNHNIFYIIEGDMNHIKNTFKYSTVDKKMIFSAMFSLQYYKGFSVLRTMNIDETAYIICNMLCKVNKGREEKREPFYKNIMTEKKEEEEINKVNEDSENEKNSSYCHVVKKVKKENVTPENISEIMLCQIPSISSVTAIAMMKEFQTLDNMIEKIKKEGVTCLQKVQYTNEKQQMKKLNKTVISNVVKFLLPKNENSVI
jgi:ERCC4-type nuclease